MRKKLTKRFHGILKSCYINLFFSIDLPLSYFYIKSLSQLIFEKQADLLQRGQLLDRAQRVEREKSCLLSNIERMKEKKNEVENQIKNYIMQESILKKNMKEMRSLF